MNTDLAQITDAVDQLSRTAWGRDALRRIFDWFEEGGGRGLDAPSKAAARTLLDAAWGSFPGTAREAMRLALAGWE